MFCRLTCPVNETRVGLSSAAREKERDVLAGADQYLNKTRLVPRLAFSIRIVVPESLTQFPGLLVFPRHFLRGPQHGIRSVMDQQIQY